MKKLKIISLITLVVMLFSFTNVVFAYDDYCPETDDGWHDYNHHKSMKTKHPHRGYRECLCGDRVDLDYQYDDECEICREELCEEGLHYYLYDIQYLDEYGHAGYGECYCGRKKYFSYDEDYLKREPYEGYIEFFGDLYLVEHPHYQYDTQRNRCNYDDTIHAGGCGVCELEDEYFEAVREYEIHTLIYEEEYFEDDEYYWYDEDEYEEDIDHSDELDDYDEDDYSASEYDDFHTWLELVQEILKE